MIRVVDMIRREYPVRVYQWLILWMALTATWAVGIYGVAAYSADQAAASQRDSLAAQYAGALASYQNARDERTRCEQAVDTRADLRGVLLGIFNAIDPDGSGELVPALRVQLDRDYPPRTVDQCAPIPVPPVPPSRRGG